MMNTLLNGEGMVTEQGSPAAKEENIMLCAVTRHVRVVCSLLWSCSCLLSFTIINH